MPTLNSPATDNGDENALDAHETSSTPSSRSPLDRTMERIGMGSYQFVLLGLCGLGWTADNMWLQAVAIALPRVQVHYNVSSTSIGYLSAATFLGMMLGALLWGTLSDILGRMRVFHLTLFFSAVFGFLAFYVDSFQSLCFANFLLGSAVGGSMPTDGTFALETLPHNKRHLLTSLSIFFSVGSVIAAVVALLVVPGNSCPPTSHDHPPETPCDVQKQNNGWRYLFLISALITVAMFLARVLFFRLHESPRYLVHAGREEEAAIALTDIAEFNGNRMRVTVMDVRDDEESEGISTRGLGGDATEREGLLERSPPRSHLENEDDAATSQRPTNPSKPNAVLYLIRKWLSIPLEGWYQSISGLLSGEWRERTLLIWGIWMTMSFAYTIFNVFLPTFLEYRSEASIADEPPIDESSKSLSGPLWEVVIFTLGGCPGALLGAYLVDNVSRYRISKSLLLAFVTLVTGVSCLAFVLVSGYYTVMVTTMVISLMSTAMWSILYGMTPELFITEVRGSACGTASALSRLGGILAPLVGGVLVSINPSLIVIASVIVFIVSVVFLIMLDRSLKRSHPSTPTHGSIDDES